jgi:hypothetical protein
MGCEVGHSAVHKSNKEARSRYIAATTVDPADHQVGPFVVQAGNTPLLGRQLPHIHGIQECKQSRLETLSPICALQILAVKHYESKTNDSKLEVNYGGNRETQKAQLPGDSSRRSRVQRLGLLWRRDQNAKS